ncbi:MAG: hypothetical protein ACPH3I_07135 [Porticoccaceae bacterium]
MVQRLISIAIAFYLTLVSSQVAACFNHFYLNPDNYGVVKGTAIKLAGLAPPEPVFKLKHPPVAKATLGEESEITVEYKRPWRSSNVYMQLKSTSGIRLIDNSIALEEFDGLVKVRYSLEKAGLNSITIQVNGEHKGQSITNSRMIYIRANPASIKANSLQANAQ